MMTTVQDLESYGYQSQGFSVAGVMDVRSFKIANLLLDNPENEAVLEITLIGPTLSLIHISAKDSLWREKSFSFLSRIMVFWIKPVWDM